MKKFIAIVIAAMMVLTMVPAVMLTASAAGEGDFWARRDVGGYDEEQGEPTYKPASGYYYDAEGFHTVSPVFTGMTSRLIIRSKDSMNLKEGMSLTVRVDDYPYGGDNGADHWLSFALFDQAEMAPANTKHGNGTGWVCLIRGNGDGSAELQSFWQTPANENEEGGAFAQTGAFTAITAELDEEGRELYTLTAEWDGSAYSVKVNGEELPGMSDVSDKMIELRPDGDFFFTFCTHSGVVGATVAASITEYNGSVPTGTDNVEPEDNLLIPADIIDADTVAENRPCFLWDANATCHSGKPSADGLNVFAQADGSYHVKPIKGDAVYIEASISSKVSYDASDFPVVAMLLRNYNGNLSRFWYAAGEVGSVQNDCIEAWDSDVFADEEYEVGDDIYNLALVDLDGQWSDRINSVRLEFGGLDTENEDGEFDIMWWGCFRTTEEALAFLQDYKDGKIDPIDPGTDDTTETSDPVEETGEETKDPGVEETGEDTEKATEEVTEEVTEKATENVTEEVTEQATEGATEKATENVTAAGTKAADTKAAEDSTAAAGGKGCSSVIGGAVAVVLTAAAAAVALKKKH